MKKIAAAILITLAAMNAQAGEKLNTTNTNDYKQEFYLTSKAAEQGDARAQYNLGLMYYNGLGVPQDYQQTAYWLSKAAEQGLAEAQYKLGLMYHNGEGVPQDYQQAYIWFNKAAEQGNESAQYRLGLMYFNGEGVPQNDKQAYAWFSVAVANGQSESAKNRDIAAKHLTPAMLAEAQELASRYFEKYKAK